MHTTTTPSHWPKLKEYSKTEICILIRDPEQTTLPGKKRKVGWRELSRLKQDTYSIRRTLGIKSEAEYNRLKRFSVKQVRVIFNHFLGL